jgi:hypothetical protein
MDDMEEMRRDLERQMAEYVQEAEKRLAQAMGNAATPIRKDDSLLPVPNLRARLRTDL